MQSIKLYTLKSHLEIQPQSAHPEWDCHKLHSLREMEAACEELQDISADQEGIYTCEVNDAEETTISLRSVMIHKGKVAFSHT